MIPITINVIKNSGGRYTIHNTLATGFGYNLNNRLSIETRYHLRTPIIRDRSLTKSRQRKISIILGYRFYTANNHKKVKLQTENGGT